MNALDVLITLIAPSLALASDHAQAALGTALAGVELANRHRFEAKLRDTLGRLDREKLDEAYLRSDAFKSILLGIYRAAEIASTDERREALANAVANSAMSTSTAFRGEGIVSRVLDALSDTEIAALTRLRELTEPSLNPNDPYHYYLVRHAQDTLAQELGWDRVDAAVAFQGLAQLGLVRDLGELDRDPDHGPHWYLTDLAVRLVAWVAPPGP